MPNSEDYKWPSFPNPFGVTDYGEGPEPKTLRELEMTKLSASIRRKPYWFDKMKNPEILAKWKEEAKAQGLTDNQISYVLQELTYYDALRQPENGIQVSDVDGVWHSDTLVEDALRKELLNGVERLEDIPVAKRDWHPGSRKQVWNLVHPSLYPLMYGKTRIVPKAKPALKFCGGGNLVAVFELHHAKILEHKPKAGQDNDSVEGEEEAADDEANDFVSSQEQDDTEKAGGGNETAHEDDDDVLADEEDEGADEVQEEAEAEVDDGEEGSEADESDNEEGAKEATDDDEATTDEEEESDSESDPGNPYGIDEDDFWISKKFSWLPTDVAVNKDGTVKILSYINNLHPKHHKGLYGTLEKILSKFIPLFEKVLQDQTVARPNRIILESNNFYGDAEYPGEDDDEDENYDENYEEWTRNRPLILPDAPEKFVPPPAVAETNRISLRGKSLQVIVKLANIVLTPENPKFRGGVWHVEGMENERIVASGIYYYDVSNISNSELAFRQHVCEPGYEQGDDRGVEGVYGLQNEEALNQFLGSVQTSENRCLAFPNIYQHRVQPFQLTDSTKPGHRKILVFFLVDPGNPVTVSTSSVPPQQLDWYLEELQKIPPFNTLPYEVFCHIASFIEWPLSLKAAKKMRRKLMRERKYFVSKNSEQYFERPFSLCEH